MENPDKWKEELERVEQLKEAEKEILPFGYDYILAVLNDISANIRQDTLFVSGVMLGMLIEVIKANKDKE